MEDPEIRRRKIKHERKKERERAGSSPPEGEGESPPAKKRKVRKPSFYEDIIDGFAIRSFKTYEELTRAVELETGQSEALNGSQESTGGARIRGSGGGSGDNNKVGSNESPSKESGKSSASTKSPKSKKKKLSTTNQENDQSGMQGDLNRCSSLSSDHAIGNGSSGPGSMLDTGMAPMQQQQQPQQQQPLTPSHPHSFSQFQEEQLQQQQQFSQQPESVVTALKPHPQHPKKARVGKDVRKNHICKSEVGGSDITAKKSDDRKELFAVSRKDFPLQNDVADNLHHHSTQTVNLGEVNQHLSHVDSKAGRATVATNSTSTSTYIDHLNNIVPPTTVSVGSTSTTNTVATQYANTGHSQDHQKSTLPSRPSNLLPSSASTSSVNSGIARTDVPISRVTIKKEVPEIDARPVANGPISPPKRQIEVNGHGHISHFGTQPDCSGTDLTPSPVTPQQPSHHSSQAAFSPISQPSPKSVSSSGLQPAQQQVVAPVSDPKEKFGQGRIGSQTLFTPYATTAITRVRSPLGGGGPPSAPSACGGSQSNVTTVIQPESPKEPLIPPGSPYSSLSHHHQHPNHSHPPPPPHNQYHQHYHHQHHPHHHHHHQHHQHHHHSLKNNQNLHQTINHNSSGSSSNSSSSNNQNRVRSIYNSYNNNLPVGNSYSPNSANILSNTSSNTNSNSSNKPSQHQLSHSSSSSATRKPHPSFSNSGENYNTQFGRPQIENCYKKDHASPEQSFGTKTHHQSVSSSGSRNSQPSPHHKIFQSSKDKGIPSPNTPVATNKPNTAKAFGSIARLLDPSTSTSSSQGSTSSHPTFSGKNPVPTSGAPHSHSPHNIGVSSSHSHHHHPHTSTNIYSGALSQPSSVVSVGSGSFAHSLQHPGSSSSAGSNSSASTIPLTNIGSSSAASNNHQGAVLSNNQTNSLAASASTQSCSSRSHSPRGHSPTRERDSYSSNVSSLSRSSATPVSGSQPSSHLQLPPNLSPQLQSSSYSKAASWLSTVPGLSPVPRPTPPPTTHSLSGHPSGHSGGNLGSLALQPSSVTNPFGGYPGVAPPHGLPSPHPAQSASMFAPPILPLSSISSHPATQPPSFGPATDAMYPGPTSDMVRKDLESRLISADRAVAGGPSPFMARPSDLHPHHPLLPPLSGVGHLPPHTHGAPPTAPPPHSALFPPPLFKDIPKMGIDSPFYRTNMGMSYPGFNGILPPPGLTTPFAPPTQLPTYTQKKTGKWNAMHVRIAWEIYQHQQKGGTLDGASKSINSSASSSSKAVPPPSTVGNIVGLSAPPVSASSSGPSTSLTADLLRSSSHAFMGLGRAGEAPPPFTAPILSPHAPPPHASPRGTPYDPLFLNSPASHLGPPLPRYPGFGALGPSFGGLSGLGSSLLGRDLPSLVGLSPGQDQWTRFPTRPPFPGASSSLGANWQVQRPERDSKTPTETRRHKEIDVERPSRHSESRDRESRGRDSSPFRDRSPVRPVRTPLENGDGDSRSSRSNDSHSNSTSAVHSSKSSGRSKEDSISSNGDRDKASTPSLSAYERERMAAADKSVPLHASSHPSRMYPPSSPLTTPISSVSAWDAFPGFLGAGPRMGLSLLQLSERERELARIPPPSAAALRPGLFSNGPYGPLPLGVLGGAGALAPGSSVAVSTSKASPLGGPIPLLNAGVPPSPVSHSHIHSSQQQNGPHSPSTGSSKSQNQSEDNKHVPPSHGSRSKEDSHQSR